MSGERLARSLIGVGGLLGVLFIWLRLTGHVDWSWWWVLVPLWAISAVALLLLLVVGIAVVASRD